MPEVQYVYTWSRAFLINSSWKIKISIKQELCLREQITSCRLIQNMLWCQMYLLSRNTTYLLALTIPKVVNHENVLIYIYIYIYIYISKLSYTKQFEDINNCPYWCKCNEIREKASTSITPSRKKWNCHEMQCKSLV